MRRSILALGLVLSSLGYAKMTKKSDLGITDLVGKYQYKEHSLYKDNRQLDISQFYEPIYLEILPDSTIRCALKMSGKSEPTVGKAKIKEIGKGNGENYWVAAWDDMSYAVRTTFSKNGKHLNYEIEFTNAADTQRFGMKEVSKLVQEK
jgi:hypothetical protein